MGASMTNKIGSTIENCLKIKEITAKIAKEKNEGILQVIDFCIETMYSEKFKDTVISVESFKNKAKELVVPFLHQQEDTKC